MTTDDGGTERQWTPLRRGGGAARFESCVVTLAPGATLAPRESGWQGALLAVTSGSISLRRPDGAGIELRAGAMFWLEDGSRLTVVNVGTELAGIHAVRRRAAAGDAS